MSDSKRPPQYQKLIKLCRSNKQIYRPLLIEDVGALGWGWIHLKLAIITSTSTLTWASKSQIKRRVIKHLPLAPPKEFHQIKCRGHHQQAIDEIRTLGLGAATPVLAIGAKAASTMVCWKHPKWRGRWYVFLVGDILTAKWSPKQRQLAYFYVSISSSSGLHTINSIPQLQYPFFGCGPLYSR